MPVWCFKSAPETVHAFIRCQDVVKICPIWVVKLDYGVGFNKVEYILRFNQKGFVIVPKVKAPAFLFTRIAYAHAREVHDNGADASTMHGRISVDTFLGRVRRRRGTQLIKTTSESGVLAASLHKQVK